MCVCFMGFAFYWHVNGIHLFPQFSSECTQHTIVNMLKPPLQAPAHDDTHDKAYNIAMEMEFGESFI